MCQFNKYANKTSNRNKCINRICTKNTWYCSHFIEEFLFDETKKVCYGDLGCFAVDDPFDNTLGYLPESPGAIQFGLTLYTRANTKPGVKLGYNDSVSVTRSSFNPNTPIKIIIHGYMSDANEPWVLNISNLFLKKVSSIYLLM